MGVGSVNWGREGEGETKRKREEGLIPSEFIFNRIVSVTRIESISVRDNFFIHSRNYQTLSK